MITKKLLLSALVLPTLVHAAAGALSVDVLLSKPTEAMDDMLRVKLPTVNKDALASPVGQCYVVVDEEGVDSLQEEPEIKAQAGAWDTLIVGDYAVQKRAHRIEEAKKAGKTALEREVLLGAYGATYAKGLKWLVKPGIPNLNLYPGLKKTVENNTKVELDDAQRVQLLAAQLCMTYNLQRQYELDHEAFDLMFNRFLSPDADSEIVEESTTPEASEGKWFKQCSLQ